MARLYFIFFIACLIYLAVKNLLYSQLAEGQQPAAVILLKTAFAATLVIVFYRSIKRESYG